MQVNTKEQDINTLSARRDRNAQLEKRAGRVANIAFITAGVGGVCALGLMVLGGPLGLGIGAISAVGAMTGFTSLGALALSIGAADVSKKARQMQDYLNKKVIALGGKSSEPDMEPASKLSGASAKAAFADSAPKKEADGPEPLSPAPTSRLTR